MPSEKFKTTKKSKEIYVEWSEGNSQLPIFLRPYWLDVVCNCNWDVAISYGKDGGIRGVLPYVVPRSLLKISRMPKQTQFLGPWIVYHDSDSNTRTEVKRQISKENEIHSDLIQQLPPMALFKQKFSYRVTNWLSYYWHGFDQTTHYTYQLDLKKTEQQIFEGFRTNIRGDIRKAQRQVVIESSLTAGEFFEINKKTFDRQALSVPYREDFVKAIDAELVARKQRRIFSAKDSAGNIHAAVYIIWDGTTSYYLWGGGDPQFRSSGATSLLIWEAIKFSKSLGIEIFDFEGSMIKPVERFVRAFGSQQVPYFVVTKKSRLMKLIFGLIK